MKYIKYSIIFILTVLLSWVAQTLQSKIQNKEKNSLKKQIANYTFDNKLNKSTRSSFFKIISEAYLFITPEGKKIDISIYNDDKKSLHLEEIEIDYAKKCNIGSTHIKIQQKINPGKTNKIPRQSIDCSLIKQIHYTFKENVRDADIIQNLHETPIIKNKVISIEKLIISEASSFDFKQNHTYILENLTILKKSLISIPTLTSVIIKNRLDIIGSESSPVIIKGAHNAGGILVDGAENVMIKNAVISGFGAGLYNNEYYPAALTMLRTREIKIDKLTLKNNMSEDAINIHTAHRFYINKLNIMNSKDDGIDINNSFGDIYDSTFSICGGDCLDFYHSHVNLKEIRIDLAKDKAISVGEESKIFVSDTKITKSNIGIGIKDGSFIKIVNVKINAKDSIIKNPSSVITKKKNTIDKNNVEYSKW